MTAQVTFTATVQLDGATATGIVVPPEVVEQLGGKGRIPVQASINGHTWSTSVARMGGQAKVAVNAGVRDAAGVAAGDEVEVTLAVDDTPRTVEVPAELEAAFADEPALRTAYDALSHSRKRQLVDPIGQAKAADTRQRRVDKALEALRD